MLNKIMNIEKEKIEINIKDLESIKIDIQEMAILALERHEKNEYEMFVDVWVKVAMKILKLKRDYNVKTIK